MKMPVIKKSPGGLTHYTVTGEFANSPRKWPSTEVSALGLPLFGGSESYLVVQGELVALDGTGKEAAYYDPALGEWKPAG